MNSIERLSKSQNESELQTEFVKRTIKELDDWLAASQTEVQEFYKEPA